jgi:hypothetical protein
MFVRTLSFLEYKSWNIPDFVLRRRPTGYIQGHRTSLYNPGTVRYMILAATRLERGSLSARIGKKTRTFEGDQVALVYDIFRGNGNRFPSNHKHV